MTLHKNESICQTETYEKVIQCSLLTVLLIASVIGNGCIFLLLARFKYLQTSANILVANLATWDILQTLTWTPFYAGYAVFNSPNIGGKNLSLSFITLRYLFGLGTVSAMALLMTDRWMALAYGLKYTAWKSPAKVFRVVLAQSVFCAVITISLTAPLHSIDLGNVSYKEYDKAYLSTNHILAGQAILTFFLVIYAMLAAVTWRAMTKQRQRLKQIGLRIHTGRDRIGRDTKAVWTVWIVVAIFVMSFLPVILQVCSLLPFDCKVWCRFYSAFLMFTPLASNPIIYFLRTQRFRRALKQLLRKGPVKQFTKSSFTSTRTTKM